MKKKFLIVASDYYKDITKNLISNSLKKLKSIKRNITIIKVPGTLMILISFLILLNFFKEPFIKFFVMSP